MSTVPSIIVMFDSEEHLRQEYATRLSKGVIYTFSGGEVGPGDGCEVVLLHPLSGDTLSLSARVVSKAGEDSVVCRIDGFGPEIDAKIRALAGLAPLVAEAQPAAPPLVEEPDTIEEVALPGVSPGIEATTDAPDTIEEITAPSEGESKEPSLIDGDDPHLVRTKLPAHVHARLRELKGHEIYKVARTGNLAERTALERIYGKTVWEPLLQNQNLTPPEVARIARMGTLPKPLLDTIASHAGWISKSLVRRALLTNPRLSGRSLTTVLRALPKNELKAVPQQSIYTYRVKEAAKRLLGK